MIKQADFYLAIGDRLPAFKVTLLNPNGTPVNLTGATVMFSMQISSEVNPVITGAATIIGDPTLGVVSYAWGPTDTLVAGDYLAEWVATFSGELPMTFPNACPTLVRIRDHI